MSFTLEQLEEMARSMAHALNEGMPRAGLRFVLVLHQGDVEDLHGEPPSTPVAVAGNLSATGQFALVIAASEVIERACRPEAYCKG